VARVPAAEAEMDAVAQVQAEAGAARRRWPKAGPVSGESARRTGQDVRLFDRSRLDGILAQNWGDSLGSAHWRFVSIEYGRPESRELALLHLW
jgi:hypothetical protein